MVCSTGLRVGFANGSSGIGNRRRGAHFLRDDKGDRKLIPMPPSAVSPSVSRGRSRDEDHTSDEGLLSGIAVGDDRAGLVFVRRYQRRLFGLAMGIVGDPGLAEDIAQEAFIRIFRHAVVFDVRRGSVTTWALTITRNLAIDALRLRRGVPTDPDDRVFVELTSTERQPDQVAVAQDSLDRVRVALADLPIDQRRAVVLSALYGRTAAEIADSESIPLGTAKGRIRLGIARLRDAILIEESQ
jgi:RNA polymerase sigma-70 factor (ECF subfamily)